MNRIGEEEFSDPLTFTSTFSISPEAWGKEMTSERSGLGWTFKIVRETLFSRILQIRLYLHLEPSTTGLSKSLSFRRIRSTATIESNTNTPKIDTQTIANVTGLLSPTSTIGIFSYTPNPSPSKKNGPNATIKLRVVVELLSDAPYTFEERTASVLADSICSGDMINTKFFLYSKHYGNYGASHPKPIFANSDILLKFGLEVFLASEGFKSSGDVPIDLYCVAPDDNDIETYEYDSDSDLEDEEEDERADEEIAGKKDDISRANDFRNELVRIQAGSDVQFLRSGRVIFIKDTAFRTWRAFINYVYFSQINFSKLQSNFATTSDASIRFTEGKKCSPKSMYRLADKFGIDTLKKVALANIKSQLTQGNILKEVFSRFSSKYPDVLNVEVDFLLKNCSSSVIQTGVNEALKKFGSPRDHHLQFAMQRIVEGIMAKAFDTLLV